MLVWREVAVKEGEGGKLRFGEVWGEVAVKEGEKGEYVSLVRGGRKGGGEGRRIP